MNQIALEEFVKGTCLLHNISSCHIEQTTHLQMYATSSSKLSQESKARNDWFVLFVAWFTALLTWTQRNPIATAKFISVGLDACMTTLNISFSTLLIRRVSRAWVYSSSWLFLSRGNRKSEPVNFPELQTHFSYDCHFIGCCLHCFTDPAVRSFYTDQTCHPTRMQSASRFLVSDRWVLWRLATSIIWIENRFEALADLHLCKGMADISTSPVLNCAHKEIAAFVLLD